MAGQGVDWKQAKMIEGSSATTKAGSWKGTGRRIIGQKKNEASWRGKRERGLQAREQDMI